MFLTRDEVRALDRRAIEEFGIPGVVLMENAGRGAAEPALALGKHRPVVVCCGEGTNSGPSVLPVVFPPALAADPGLRRGPPVGAEHAIVFVAEKRGFATPASREWLGQVHVVGFGTPHALFARPGRWPGLVSFASTA